MENAITRRKTMGLLGLGALSMQFPSILYRNETFRGLTNDQKLHYLTITEIGEMIKSKVISSVELTRFMLHRIAVVDKSLHSYVTIMDKHAIAAAEILDEELENGKYRGVLHGIPIAIKDLLYTKGVRTMAGTKVLSDFIPDFDSTVVARLEAAGAVILGKLTLCEGAQAPYHPDLKVPVNPWDSSRWSGVSSSGSGVATAARLCYGSIGTDTGGSIRYPSAANGCVGLKPTYGRVSRYGVYALAESMDHVGPMTRSVKDAAIMFDAIAGYDSHDLTSLSLKQEPVIASLNKGVENLRIGIDRNYAMDKAEPDVAQAIDSVLTDLIRLGADIVEITMPDLGDLGSTWYTLGTVEAVLANANTFPSHKDEYGPGFRSDLEYGINVTGVEYAAASKARTELTGQLYRMLSGVDCMVCPSMSNAAQIKTADPTTMTWQEWHRLNINDSYTKPFNFSGVPTLSVPCGFSSEGLPLSVQFVGSKMSEDMICRIGFAYEQANGWHKLHPNV
jgi:amidase